MTTHDLAEYVERDRGHLYAFHQLIGRADFLFEDAARGLDATGHHPQAIPLWRNLVGRDVLEGRWTFQVVVVVEPPRATRPRGRCR